ncbi:DUF4145 domain-containing protein [Streptomyces lunaelactis]|uniref:DUF4145 domain-containing protein n=1 Tax=Streptomyces lunaelactis TaxID=1535768 RepID=UPI001584EC7C|nr:DUF4145 domain-containing protein [Streptomyces lunaelactis]NUL05356.1 DUF4145 domain-containing protein [Streptomyces lunaelactis]
MAEMSTVCGWCGRYANMKPCSPTARMREIASGHNWAQVEVQLACACDYCGGINIAVGEATDRDMGQRTPTDDEIEHWVPGVKPVKDYEHVPEQIAAAALEAHCCLAESYLRGAVAIARSVVESTAKVKGITSGLLHNKIDEMFDRKLIREHVRDAAHEVRFSGNEIAHGDLVDTPLPHEDAEEILGLMDEILDEIFQSPARVAQRKQKRLDRQAAQGGTQNNPSTT